jgi:hypothetical protein
VDTFLFIHSISIEYRKRVVEISIYLCREKAKKFLRAQGSNLRLKDGYCIEIDASGEWWVKDLHGDLTKEAEALYS